MPVAVSTMIGRLEDGDVTVVPNEIRGAPSFHGNLSEIMEEFYSQKRPQDLSHPEK